eukprot:4241405-Lingulodinium_polyedra.AAC.1
MEGRAGLMAGAGMERIKCSKQEEEIVAFLGDIGVPIANAFVVKEVKKNDGRRPVEASVVNGNE